MDMKSVLPLLVVAVGVSGAPAPSPSTCAAAVPCPKVAMPEPGALPELGVAMAAIFSFALWRRRKLPTE